MHQLTSPPLDQKVTRTLTVSVHASQLGARRFSKGKKLSEGVAEIMSKVHKEKEQARQVPLTSFQPVAFAQGVGRPPG